MEAATATWLVGIMIVGIMAFVGWVLQAKLTQVDSMDDRLIQVETKINVLGDINHTLHLLRTDIEIIKVRMEPTRPIVVV